MPLVFTRIILDSSCQTIINQYSWLCSEDKLNNSLGYWILSSTHKAILLFFLKGEKVPFASYVALICKYSVWLSVVTLVKNTNNCLALCIRAAILRKTQALNIYTVGMDRAKFSLQKVCCYGIKTQLIFQSKMPFYAFLNPPQKLPSLLAQ